MGVDFPGLPLTACLRCGEAVHPLDTNHGPGQVKPCNPIGEGQTIEQAIALLLSRGMVTVESLREDGLL